MSKKQDDLPDEARERQFAATIRDSANNIWLAGLGAFAMAQEEGEKLFEMLIKEGEAVQKRTKKAADSQMAVVNAGAGTRWDKLEQVFEDRVAQAIHSLGVPGKKDIDTLAARVAELTAVVEKLSVTMDKGRPKKPARRTSKTSPQ